MKSPTNDMCAEKQWIGIKISLHAVTKMVEPTHRSRLTGEGFKPPKGAVVKSYGIERLGKDFVKNEIRYK